MTNEKPAQPCCPAWEAAHRQGTDSEMWGPLACTLDDKAQTTQIGCDLPPVRFCPWCGNVKVPTIEDKR